MNSSIQAVLSRLEALHPRVIDLSLGRIERLLATLNHPERQLPPVLHIAGTNGKGSTLAFCRAALEAAGHNIHIYTSPHLVRFNERITVAGREIEDRALIDLLKQVEEANAEEPITFFEITTAAAFLAFATPADFLLLETGLGGRLDATNLVDKPRLTALSRIGMDHQHFLGDTLVEIAAEKCGILKPGVTCVTGEQQTEALEAVTQTAEQIGAPLYRQGVDWIVNRQQDELVFEGSGKTLRLPLPALQGAHQVNNAGLALACLEQLTEFSIPEAALSDAMTKVSWPARLQRLMQGALVAQIPPAWSIWLDGGHNPDAGQALASWIAGQDQPVHLVTGLLSTKDANGFLGPIAPLAASLTAVPIRDHEHIAPTEIAAIARKSGCSTTMDETPLGAVRNILQNQISQKAIILICGSLYLAGEVLADHR